MQTPYPSLLHPQSRLMRMKARVKQIVTIVILMTLSQGCSGNRAISKIRYEEGIFSDDEYVCMRAGKNFRIFRVNSDAKLMAVDSVYWSEYSPNTKFIAFDPQRKRLYFSAQDSVFSFDKRTGLLTTLSKGRQLENITCSRISPDGKYIALSSSPWNWGKIQFWHLVIINALEGGIEFYCDSLPNPSAFRWMRPGQISFLAHSVETERWDTTVSIYNFERRSVGAGRGDAREFEEFGCEPSISPGAKWEIVNENGMLKVVPGKRKNYLPNE